MKRAITALVAGVMIFAAVYGLAASLGITADSLGAGDSAVAACQSLSLSTSYTTVYNASSNAYTVGVVTVNNLQASCYSTPFKITISNNANASLGQVMGTTPSSGSSFTADFTLANVSATNAYGVHLVIG